MTKPTGNPGWQKGVSGNPSGRPKSKPFTDWIKRIGDEEGAYEKVARALYAKAIDGDVRAIAEVVSRIEGKLSDKLIVNSESFDLTALLSRKASDNAENIERSDGSEVPDGSGDA